MQIDAVLRDVHHYYKFDRHTTTFLHKPYFLFSRCAHLLFALWVAEQDHPIGLFAEDAGLAAFLSHLDFGPLRYIEYRRRMLQTDAYEEHLKNELTWFKFWGRTLQELQGAPLAGPREFARQFLACTTDGKLVEGRLTRRRHKALADLVQSLEAGRFCLHSIWILEDLISAVTSYVATQPPAVHAIEQMQSLVCLLSQLRRNIIWETVAEGPYALLSDSTWGAPSALVRLRCGRTPGRLRVAPKDEGGQVICTYTWQCASQLQESCWTREIAALPHAYEETLFKTWPQDRQDHAPDGSGVMETGPQWIIRALEAGNLEAIARKVDTVLERLVTDPSCESLVARVAEVVRNGRSEWTACELPWLYIKELDHLIGTLKFACREAKVLGGEHPAATVITNLWPIPETPPKPTSTCAPDERAPKEESLKEDLRAEMIEPESQAIRPYEPPEESLEANPAAAKVVSGAETAAAKSAEPVEEGPEEDSSVETVVAESQPVESRERAKDPAASSGRVAEPQLPREQVGETVSPVESPKSPVHVDTLEPVSVPPASESYAPDEGPAVGEPTEPAAGAERHSGGPGPCLSERSAQPSEAPDRQPQGTQAIDKLERMMTTLLGASTGSHGAGHKPNRHGTTRSARATDRSPGQAAAQILAGRLRARHGAPTDQDRCTPMSAKQLEFDLGWTRAKVQRVMTQIFGSKPFQTYRQACRNEAVCTFLARLDGDVTNTPENELACVSAGWMMRRSHPASG